jgi:capsular polysaccharide biosynthesis protein
MASPLPERSTAFVLLAVLFTGLILGVGAAFLADLFDPTVRYAAELEEILGTSVIEEFEPMNVVQGAA